MFLEITGKPDGLKMLINSDTIMTVATIRGDTMLVFTDDSEPLIVEESYAFFKSYLGAK